MKKKALFSIIQITHREKAMIDEVFKVICKNDLDNYVGWQKQVLLWTEEQPSLEQMFHLRDLKVQVVKRTSYSLLLIAESMNDHISAFKQLLEKGFRVDAHYVDRDKRYLVKNNIDLDDIDLSSFKLQSQYFENLKFANSNEQTAVA